MTFTQAEVARIRLEMRLATIREAAMIADEMAADLEESVRDGSDPGPFTAEQVIKGYLMIAKLIRRLDEA